MQAEDVFGFASELAALKQRDLLRRRREIDSPQGPRITIHGRIFLNFCSNDYLALANDGRLVRALQRAAGSHGVGSGASQLICGRHAVHRELEETLARITGRERAVVFSSGYLANLAVITALCPGSGGLIVEDRLCHASLIDGARLSRADFKRYRHGDVESLAEILKNSEHKQKLVLTDGVFSMDGDMAPLARMAPLCREHGACLVVDDAHGFGVLGPRGLGTLDSLGLDQEAVPVLIGTFGKALGCFGAFAAGPDSHMEMLVQRARPYIYTTALPAALAATVLESLRLMQQESWRRKRLQALTARFRQGARERGLPLKASTTPIQPLMVGDPGRALALSERLLRQGILITAIRPPTVPENSSRLRITLTAGHDDGDVERLLETLAAASPAD